MTNFPGAKFEVPTKLSPFVDDAVRQPLLTGRVSSSLLSVFSTPSAELEVLRKTEFPLPRCYYRSYVQGESEFNLKPQHLKQMSIQALFYCFHNMPGDIIQVLAARELASRGWKFHSEIKKWFRQAASGDVPSGSGLIYFDPKRWEERPYPSSIDQSKLLAASDHNLPAGVSVGVLKYAPPGRAPPVSPPSMGPHQAPMTPSSVIR